MRAYFGFFLFFLIVIGKVFPAVQYTVVTGTDANSTGGGVGSGNSGDLRWVLNKILSDQATTSPTQRIVVFSPAASTVTVANALPMINLFATEAVTFNSGSTTTVTISGNNSSRLFYCVQGDVTFTNMNLNNGAARGGNGANSVGGGGAGGGGMGAGAALFIDSAKVTLDSVSFNGNNATGGSEGTEVSGGNTGGGAGGGGLGGNGGVSGLGSSPNGFGGGGGGGGYVGSGGVGGSVLSNSTGGSGGGGGVGNGGNAATAGAANFSGAGGGGGSAILGTNGGNSSTVGGTNSSFPFGGGGGGGDPGSNAGAGGGTNPGAGGGTTGGGGGGGLNGSAGAASSGTAQGGNGGQGGGAGGGGIAGTSAAGGTGGAGGGGGGGGGTGSGGAGGYGGGGGGGLNLSTFIGGGNGNTGGGGGGGGAGTSSSGFGSSSGGNGGLGGGGGGSGSNNTATSNKGGNGGVGGGGGGSGAGVPAGFPGTGGIGAISGSSGGSNIGGNGGTGASFGGAIFLNSTGSLIVKGNASTSGNTVISNSGIPAAVGQDLFVVGGGTVTFQPTIDQTITYNGTIADTSLASVPSGHLYTPGSGPGANLVKTSAGTAVLTAANTYSGTTSVSGGVLNISGSILSNSVVTGGNLLIAGSTSGSITVNGGIATIDGTASGALTVNSGGLATVIGTASGLVTVNSGGNLNGTGFFLTNTVAINNGGTITPGNNAIGTIHVNTLTMQSEANAGIEINPATSSLIAVTNTAFLGGTVQLKIDPGFYGTSGSYTILTAPSGNISGTFQNGVNGGLLGYLYELEYFSDHVELLYSLFIPTPPGPCPKIDTTGLHGNALIVAEYLNQNCLNSLPFFNLTVFGPGDLKNALNSISPARNAFPAFAAQNTLFMINDIVSQHLDNQRFTQGMNRRFEYTPLLASSDSGIPCMPRPCKDKFSLWIGGFGEQSHQQSQHQVPTFSFISEAALAAMDYMAKDNFLVGFGGGYARTRIHEEQDAGKAFINYYFGTFYSTLTLDQFYAEFVFWGVYHRVNNTRHISYPGIFIIPGVDSDAISNYNGWQIDPHLGIGCNFDTSWGGVEPYGMVDWAINWENKFLETGAGELGVFQKRQISSMVRAEAGLKFYETAERSWGLFLVRQKIGYVYKRPFGTGKITASLVGFAGFFTVESLQNVQNLISPGIEFLWKFKRTKGTTFSITYEGEFSKRYQANELYLKIVQDF